MSKKGPRLHGGDHKGSDRSKHTRSPGYRPGDNWLVCDVCGCHIYSSDALQRWDGMVVCKQDWEPRHEQDFVRARKDRLVPAGLLRPESDDNYLVTPVNHPVPAFSAVPNFYSVTGIPGGNVVPPPATPYLQTLTTEGPGGIDMNQYLLNPPVYTGSWEVSGSIYVTIDPVSGVIQGSEDAAVGKHLIKVSAANRGGRGYTEQFEWEVLTEDGYQLDFDKAAAYQEIQAIYFASDGGQTYKNHLAQSTVTAEDGPALVGQDGPDYSVESNVGYGIDFTIDQQTHLTALLNTVDGLPDNGMEMEVSGHIIARVSDGSLPWPANDWVRLFSVENAKLDDVPDDPYGRKDFSQVSLFTGNAENSLTFAYRTRGDNRTDPNVSSNGYKHVETGSLPLTEGMIIDVRFKLSKEYGAKLWVKLDGATVIDGQEEPTFPLDPQIVAIDALGISNGPYSGVYESNIAMLHTHFVASGYVEDATILAWPEWEHPLPIILHQPMSQSIPQGGNASFTVSIQHPYPTYLWQIDMGSGWEPAGSTTNTLTLTGFSTTGTHPVQCVINNPAGGSVTTASGVTLTVT